MRIKRGSKKFRKIIAGKEEQRISSNINKFAEITDTVINLDFSERLNCHWVKPYYSNVMRVFIFKYYNNLLGLNSRVAHFVRNHPRTCTFCDLARIRQENSETIKHLFYDCNLVEEPLANFFLWLGIPEIGYRDFFLGINTQDVNKNKMMDIVLNVLRKAIWDCILRYCLPTGEYLKKTFLFESRVMYTASKKFRDIVAKSGYFTNHAEIRF